MADADPKTFGAMPVRPTHADWITQARGQKSRLPNLLRDATLRIVINLSSIRSGGRDGIARSLRNVLQFIPAALR